MDEEKKIYIGNLEFSISEEVLQKSIEEKGINPKEVKIITDKFSGKSRGFGFAEFETPEQAQSAIEALNGHDINGRSLRVSKARKSEARRPDQRSFGSGGYARTNRF